MQKREKEIKKDETYSDNASLSKKNILGVDVTDEKKETILEFIIKHCQNPTKPYYVVTPNPEMIVLASRNSDFKEVLNGSKIALDDGVGVGLAAQVMGTPLQERFTGVQLLEMLCKRVSDWPITVGFLGGGPDVAEKTVECLLRLHPNLKVTFTGQEWPDSPSGKREAVSIMNNAVSKEKENGKSILHNSKFILPRVDILFVAFGAPKQEFWMAEHVGKIPVNVMVGVGGAFDYISGKVPRAPKFLQTIGLEWAFRLFIQPWRVKRQFSLLIFVWMIIKEKFRLESHV